MTQLGLVEDRLLERWVGGRPHSSAAWVQGPSIPTVAELRAAARSMTDRLSVLTGWGWVAAASLVGFEGLEVLLGSMVAAPEFVPVVIVILAVAALIRNRWRQRAVSGLRNRRWVR
ncbi:MAG: hypothetical protein KF761_05105 [Salinibacterium sp.]|nr:hypothetical protein [Salinibacterium sp.]